MLAFIHRLKSDEALMLAYRDGDAGAFECLYRRHKDSLFAFLYNSCPQQAVVEDLAQEAWVAVVDAAPRYEPRAQFRTWLFSIGRRRLADYWRRRDNRHENLDDVPESALADPAAEPAVSDLPAALAALPGEQRDTLLLKEQGFSLEDIAAITDTGHETVKSRLRYARNGLRRQLGEAI